MNVLAPKDRQLIEMYKLAFCADVDVMQTSPKATFFFSYIYLYLLMHNNVKMLNCTLNHKSLNELPRSFFCCVLEVRLSESTWQPCCVSCLDLCLYQEPEWAPTGNTELSSNCSPGRRSHIEKML